METRHGYLEEGPDHPGVQPFFSLAREAALGPSAVSCQEGALCPMRQSWLVSQQVPGVRPQPS